MKRIVFFFLSVALAFACLSPLRAQEQPFSSAVYVKSGGGLLRAVPNAPVVFCNSPPSGGPPCTNLATTYNSVSGGLCAAGQGTIPGTSTCSSTADADGNFGAYVTPGNNYAYYFEVSSVWYGPYYFGFIGATPTFQNPTVFPGAVSSPGPVTVGPSNPAGVSAFLLNTCDPYGLFNNVGSPQFGTMFDFATGSCSLYFSNGSIDLKVFVTCFGSTPYQDGQLYVYNAVLGCFNIAPNITINSQTGQISGFTGVVQYGQPGSYSTNQGTNGNADPLQNFPCDSYHCMLLIGSFNTAPCCSNQLGETGIGPPSLTNGVQHLTINNGQNGQIVDVTTGDDVGDMAAGATGLAGSPAVRQQSPTTINENLFNPVANNFVINAPTGDIFKWGPGLGLAVPYSATTGTCIGPTGIVLGEVMSQVGGGASTFIEISPAGNLILTSPITGTASGSTTWIGARSGCTFTPTGPPATPYIQYTPTALFVQFGYGSDGRLQLSNGTKAFSDVLTALDWAAPGAIGGTTPAAGTFTALNSTSIPAAGPIGSTTPSTGKFTTLNVTTSLTINSGLLCSSTMPTVASGGGGTVAAAITGENTCSFSINIGTGSITNPLVLTFPAAVHGWHVECSDITTTSTTNFLTKQTGSVSTTSVTLTAFTDVATSSGTWTASDILECGGHAN